VYGIVNGTCNHILTTMTREGRSFGDVLADAQRLGLAEADPSTDVDGVDSAHKLALLATLAFNVVPRFADIPTEGIRRIEPADIGFARELGYTIKLLAIAKDGRDAIEARVHPTMIPNGHLLADVGGNFNAIFVRGAALGPTMYYGQGAGSMPTATAVVADLIAAVRDRAIARGCGCRPGASRTARCVRCAFGPSPTSRASTTCGSWRSTSRACWRALPHPRARRHQHRLGDPEGPPRRDDGPLVLRTHRARERNLARALREIGRLRVVRGRPVSIRIEDRLG